MTILRSNDRSHFETDFRRPRRGNRNPEVCYRSLKATDDSKLIAAERFHPKRVHLGYLLAMPETMLRALNSVY